MPASDLIDLNRERRIRSNLAELRELLATDPRLTERTGAMLAGALPCPDLEDDMTNDKELPTSMRLPARLIERADALVDKLQDHPQFEAMTRVTRATVLREALARGIAELEQEAEQR